MKMFKLFGLLALLLFAVQSEARTLELPQDETLLASVSDVVLVDGEILTNEIDRDAVPIIVMGKAKSVTLLNGTTKIVCVAGNGECCRVYPTRTVYAEPIPVIVVDENDNTLFEGQVESYEINMD